MCLYKDTKNKGVPFTLVKEWTNALAYCISKKEVIMLRIKTTKTNMMRGMKINAVSYKNTIRKVMKSEYEVIPVVFKLSIVRSKDGNLVVTNMVQDEDTNKQRFCYGIIGNSKAVRRLQPSNLKTKNKVAVEEEKDNGEKITYKVQLSPNGRYKFYDSIVMVHFGEGIALDLLTDGFRVSKDGVVTLNDNTETDKTYDGEEYEFGAPCWGPSNEKHSNAFFFNVAQRSRNEWYDFCDDLTGGAFEYKFQLEMAVEKALKTVTRWGNYMTGSIDGPSIDLKDNYICIIDREQNAAEDFKEIPDYINPGSNIQDGGEVTNAELWKAFYATKGMNISIEDCCKLSPQVRFDTINSKVMDTIEDNESIEWRLECVKELYGDKVKLYGNTDGKCMLIVDTDGAKLINEDKLNENCTINAIILAYAKTNTTTTSGQLMDKYTKKDAERTKEILMKLYRESLEEQVAEKVEADFDPNESFNNNMLALLGTDALNYVEVATGLTKDLFKFGTKAIGRLKVKMTSIYSHAKFDNTYVKTAGKQDCTLYVKYLLCYDNYAVEAYNPDILEDKKEEIAAIYADALLSEKQKEEKLDRLLTCITIKYPSAGPEEYEIVRYLTKEELQQRIHNMKLTDDARYELQKYWDRTQYGVTVYAPINIIKNKLAGMDIDYDATASDFSELKEILLADKTRIVDFIDYKAVAYK